MGTLEAPSGVVECVHPFCFALSDGLGLYWDCLVVYFYLL